MKLSARTVVGEGERSLLSGEFGSELSREGEGENEVLRRDDRRDESKN